MAETATAPGHRQSYFDGAVTRDGKILASNSGVCVEEHYSVAYNLGARDCQWPGWKNIDIREGSDIVADVRNLSMIETDSADAVAAIHLLEHFYRWEVADLLTEWKRILKPGGKLILELPCMDKVFGYVVHCVQNREPMADFMTLLPLYGDPKHRDPAMCHPYGWFTSMLVEMLEFVGMREITVCEARYHFIFRDFRVECIK